MEDGVGISRVFLEIFPEVFPSTVSVFQFLTYICISFIFSFISFHSIFMPCRLWKIDRLTTPDISILCLAGLMDVLTASKNSELEIIRAACFEDAWSYPWGSDPFHGDTYKVPEGASSSIIMKPSSRFHNINSKIGLHKRPKGAVRPREKSRTAFHKLWAQPTGGSRAMYWWVAELPVRSTKHKKKIIRLSPIYNQFFNMCSIKSIFINIQSRSIYFFIRD